MTIPCHWYTFCNAELQWNYELMNILQVLIQIQHHLIIDTHNH